MVKGKCKAMSLHKLSYTTIVAEVSSFLQERASKRTIRYVWLLTACLGPIIDQNGTLKICCVDCACVNSSTCDARSGFRIRRVILAACAPTKQRS